MKKKQTFIIEINDTQYESWQGSVDWIQGQEKKSFRSTMELLRLMDSVIRNENEGGHDHHSKED